MNHRPLPNDATPRQRRALKYERFIRSRLDRTERDWKAIKRYVTIVHDERLYDEWDVDFHEWLADIDLSRSMGFDLVAIQSSPFNGLLETLTISKARMVLPHLRDELGEPISWERAERLIEHAQEMKQDDLRQELNGDDLITKWVESQCPRCKAILELSRNAQVRIK